MVPYSYNQGNPLNLSNEVILSDTIKVLVKDEFGAGIEYINVEIIPPATCDGCPQLIWPNGVISQTDHLGKALFIFYLEDQSVVIDNIDL